MLTTVGVTVAQRIAPRLVGRALLLYDDLLNQSGHAVRNSRALLPEQGGEAIGVLI